MEFNQWAKALENKWQLIKRDIEAQWNSFFPPDGHVVKVCADDVAKVFVANDHWDCPHISCPVCEKPHAHVVSACVRTGVDGGDKGYRGVETRGKTAHRQNALCIGVEGECGHNFNIIFQQCKGTEFIVVEVLEKDLIEEAAEVFCSKKQ